MSGFHHLTGYGSLSDQQSQDLQNFFQLLEKWQKVQNLVGPSTLNYFWDRHVADSAQILQVQKHYVPLHSDTTNAPVWFDFGSGAGFPALVLSILTKQDNPRPLFHCFESNKRKVAFLQTVSRETHLTVKAHSHRIETLAHDKDAPPHFLTARALAPLSLLLTWFQPFLETGAVALLHKGAQWKKELEECPEGMKKDYNFQPVASVVDPQGVILVVSRADHPEKS
jgi:16S rRNA (guanine527-N7)-methyltransferase